MAFASTPTYQNFQPNDSTKNNCLTDNSNKPILNFYESMYHFKKMFPKFESDVIEQVLRANNGSVDKTIDQLLLMAADYESFEVEKKFVDIIDESTLAATQSSLISSEFVCFQDLPPSYNEFMSSQQTKTSEKSNDLIDLETNTDIMSGFNSEDVIKVETCASKLIDESGADEVSQMSTVLSLKNIDRSHVTIGELSRDFLRIKLNADQVKKIKVAIKKAKRSELTDIVNEKIPEEPEEKPLSFEIKAKLEALKKQTEEATCSIANEFCDDWQKSYETDKKRYEKERIQIIQDEYLAKVIQNEEFLSELKKDEDFMNTLNNDDLHVSRDWKSGDNKKNYSISNAELQAKLFKMSKNTRVKFMKLATQFTRKARQKCNKTAGQMAVACSNFFTTYNSLEYYNQSNIEKVNQNPHQLQPSRAQKVYKSFKTVIKRNPNKQLDHFQADHGYKPAVTLPGFEDYGYDRVDNQMAKIESFNMKFDKEDTTAEVPYKPIALDLFKDDYSYEDKNSTKDYIYDYSVYPPIKIFNTLTSKSSSKKVPENFSNDEKTYK